MTRYPFAPLTALMGVSEHQACLRLGVSGSTEKQYRTIGISARVADRLAVRAGFHPYEVWPEMVDHDVEAVDAERLRRQNETARRYRQRPHVAAYNRQKSRAYYAAHGDYVRARERLRYWANPELHRSRRRERYAANVEVERARARERYQREREQRLAYKRERDARKRIERQEAAA